MLTVIFPFVVDYFALVVALRAVTGFVDGMTFPAVYQMLSVWFPNSEKSTAYARPHMSSRAHTHSLAQSLPCLGPPLALFLPWCEPGGGP